MKTQQREIMDGSEKRLVNAVTGIDDETESEVKKERKTERKIGVAVTETTFVLKKGTTKILVDITTADTDDMLSFPLYFIWSRVDEP